MLHYHSVAANLTEGTQWRLDTAPVGKSHVKQLHKAVTDVTLYPLIEHVAHEPAVSF